MKGFIYWIKRIYRTIKTRHSMGFSDIYTYKEFKIVKKIRKLQNKLKKLQELS
jgi:hypothetical protein